MTQRIAISVLLNFLIYSVCLTQACLPNGILFNTQEDVDNFQANFPDCNEIEGNVEIRGNGITNLNGLLGLKVIKGRLSIWNENQLTDLKGLDSLISVGDNLFVQQNPLLQTFNGLQQLGNIGGELFVRFNYSLTSLDGLNNLMTVGKEMNIHGNNISNMQGLNNLTEVGRSCLIGFNNSLQDLKGLENLKLIGRRLWIGDNDSLIDITALHSLDSIGEFLSLSNNPLLTSLSGLDNIDAKTITGLYIKNNSVLSTCNIQSVCDYLANPSGDVGIFNNSNGCNSREEVEDACMLVFVDDHDYSYNITIIPNPTVGKLRILNNSSTEIRAVYIFDAFGMMKKISNGSIIELDVSKLPSGIYRMVVKVGGQSIGKTFVKI